MIIGVEWGHSWAGEGFNFYKKSRRYKKMNIFKNTNVLICGSTYMQIILTFVDSELLDFGLQTIQGPHKGCKVWRRFIFKVDFLYHLENCNDQYVLWLWKHAVIKWAQYLA